MGMGSDGEGQLWNAATLVATGVSTNNYDQSTAGRHMELGEDIGIGFYPSAASASGTETYQFQAISATASNLTSGQTILADTGTMQNTDTRVSNPFFLTIPPGILTQQFIGAKFIGANSPSIVVSAYLMNKAEWEQYAAQPANYTP